MRVVVSELLPLQTLLCALCTKAYFSSAMINEATAPWPLYQGASTLPTADPVGAAPEVSYDDGLRRLTWSANRGGCLTSVSVLRVGTGAGWSPELLSALREAPESERRMEVEVAPADRGLLDGYAASSHRWPSIWDGKPYATAVVPQTARRAALVTGASGLLLALTLPNAPEYWSSAAALALSTAAGIFKLSRQPKHFFVQFGNLLFGINFLWLFNHFCGRFF